MADLILLVMFLIPPVLFILFLVLTIVNAKKKNKGAKITFLILTIVQGIVVLLEVALFIMLSIAVAHM